MRRLKHELPLFALALIIVLAVVFCSGQLSWTYFSVKPLNFYSVGRDEDRRGLAGCGKSRFEGFSYKTKPHKIVLCAVQTLSSRRCSATCPRSNGFPRTIL